MKRYTVKVIFDNGDTMNTPFNAENVNEIISYYSGYVHYYDIEETQKTTASGLVISYNGELTEYKY